MSNRNKFSIAVLAGDGIGPEVIAPCINLLEAVGAALGGYSLNWTHLDAGADHYRRTGISIPDEALDVARKGDAILLGGMGLPGGAVWINRSALRSRVDTLLPSLG